MSSGAPENATNALQALSALSRAALADRWTEVFGSPVPRGAQVALLRGALAWHTQMGPAAQTEVAQLFRRRPRQASSAPTALLAPGTRLLREWQGQTHHVTVLADGFEYAGLNYKSLTAIARQITGTAWSGPLFFGLRR